MQLQLFILPVKNLTAAEAEMNTFLRSHRVVAGEEGICVGRGEPMKRQLELLRNWGVVLLLGLTSAMLAGAASSTGVSPILTVDTRVGGITVSGRVLDAANRAPISSATVTLAGQSTSSSGAGQFNLPSVSLSSGNTLTVSMGVTPLTQARRPRPPVPRR